MEREEKKKGKRARARATSTSTSVSNPKPDQDSKPEPKPNPKSKSKTDQDSKPKPKQKQKSAPTPPPLDASASSLPAPTSASVSTSTRVPPETYYTVCATAAGPPKTFNTNGPAWGQTNGTSGERTTLRMKICVPPKASHSHAYLRLYSNTTATTQNANAGPNANANLRKRLTDSEEHAEIHGEDCIGSADENMDDTQASEYISRNPSHLDEIIQEKYEDEYVDSQEERELKHLCEAPEDLPEACRQTIVKDIRGIDSDFDPDYKPQKRAADVFGDVLDPSDPEPDPEDETKGDADLSVSVKRSKREIARTGPSRDLVPLYPNTATGQSEFFYIQGKIALELCCPLIKFTLVLKKTYGRENYKVVKISGAEIPAQITADSFKSRSVAIDQKPAFMSKLRKLCVQRLSPNSLVQTPWDYILKNAFKEEKHFVEYLSRFDAPIEEICDIVDGSFSGNFDDTDALFCLLPRKEYWDYEKTLPAGLSAALDIYYDAMKCFAPPFNFSSKKIDVIPMGNAFGIGIGSEAGVVREALSILQKRPDIVVEFNKKGTAAYLKPKSDEIDRKNLVQALVSFEKVSAWQTEDIFCPEYMTELEKCAIACKGAFLIARPERTRARYQSKCIIPISSVDAKNGRAGRVGAGRVSRTNLLIIVGAHLLDAKELLAILNGMRATTKWLLLCGSRYCCDPNARRHFSDIYAVFDDLGFGCPFSAQFAQPMQRGARAILPKDDVMPKFCMALVHRFVDEIDSKVHRIVIAPNSKQQKELQEKFKEKDVRNAFSISPEQLPEMSKCVAVNICDPADSRNTVNTNTSNASNVNALNASAQNATLILRAIHWAAIEYSHVDIIGPKSKMDDMLFRIETDMRKSTPFRIALMAAILEKAE